MWNRIRHRIGLDPVRLALCWQLTCSPKKSSCSFAVDLPVINFECPFQFHIMGQSQREGCLLLSKVIDFWRQSQSSTLSSCTKLWAELSSLFVCLISFICFGKGPTPSHLSFFWFKHPSLFPPPSPPHDFHWVCCENLCQSCIMWMLGAVLGRCWCVTAAHVSPKPSSVPVLTPHHQAHSEGLCHPLGWHNMSFEIITSYCWTWPLVGRVGHLATSGNTHQSQKPGKWKTCWLS